MAEKGAYVTDLNVVHQISPPKLCFSCSCFPFCQASVDLGYRGCCVGVEFPGLDISRFGGYPLLMEDMSLSLRSVRNEWQTTGINSGKREIANNCFQLTRSKLSVDRRWVFWTSDSGQHNSEFWTGSIIHWTLILILLKRNR